MCVFYMCVLQVKTKSVLQCVEFFYLNKRLHDKQEKQKLENQDSRLEQQAVVSTLSCLYKIWNIVHKTEI